MTTIVLFHSALGLTQGVRALAARLRRDGHEVATPDLFDGETFEALEDGVRKRDALGIPELMRRVSEAADPLPHDSIYVGFSMGAGAAQFLTVARPGARGTVLIGGVLPLEALGVGGWPGVPVQVHASAGDPWVDRRVLDGFREVSSAEVYTYPGARHLFCEPAEFEPELARLLEDRVSAFAGGLNPALWG